MPLNGSDLKANTHQAMARHEIGCTLEEVIQACNRLVRNGEKYRWFTARSDWVKSYH